MLCNSEKLSDTLDFLLLDKCRERIYNIVVNITARAEKDIPKECQNEKIYCGGVIFLCLLVSACGGSGKGSETGDKPESLHNSDPENSYTRKRTESLP